MDLYIRIEREDEHYVAYVDHKFFCSADTYMEAIRELEKEGILV